MSYKVASKKEQARLRRVVPKALGDFDVRLTPEQERSNLTTIIQQLETQIKEAKEQKLGKAFVKELGKKKFDLQCQIAELGVTKRFKGIEGYFIEVTKETVTASLFDLIVKKSHERMTTENAEESA